MNKAIQLRQKVNYQLRQFLYSHSYHEADVPTLSPKLIPESYLEIFSTQISSPNLKTNLPMYLLASPEAYLKRLLVSQRQNLFYLGKAYRNDEPIGKLHNHEFTILEWYKIGYNYKNLMKEIGDQKFNLKDWYINNQRLFGVVRIETERFKALYPEVNFQENV